MGMSRLAPLTAVVLVFLQVASGCSDTEVRETGTTPLSVGAAAVAITPCGANADWDGSITATGVWGEIYDDANGNGRFDVGESFEDHPGNTAIDPASASKYDGIYLAGFGADRVAKGCHDDLWARVLVVDDGETRIAFVSVDLIGELKYGSYYGFAHAEAMLDEGHGVDHFIYSSTHNHEGPDALGLWGTETTNDGKFPMYLTFVDRQVARAIGEALGSMEDVARVRVAATDPSRSGELVGLQVRTGCRPPFVFDDELRAMIFEADGGGAIATLVNWSTHPESLESENEYVSSDFVHWIREEIEGAFGGTAVYMTADMGATEIVGDTCVGGADARNADGTNEFDDRSNLGFERTEAIGRLVGGVVVDELRAAGTLDIATIDVARATYRFAASNQTFELGRELGILDLDPEIYASELCPGAEGLCGPAEQYAITMRDGGGEPQIQIVTVPGEVFPELYLGVEGRKRTDCPEADTGAPSEPSIRDAMVAPYRFVIGMSPDEIGYIVPQYDFYPAVIFDEAEDPCKDQPYDPVYPRRRVPDHYHETLSVGVEISAYVTCTAVELLLGSGSTADDPACDVLR